MKQIFVNLKRFDIPSEYGGVNSISQPKNWAAKIIESIQPALKDYQDQAEFTFFFPEAHIIPALNVLDENSPLNIGAQSVFRDDVSEGGNFGAFTSNRTAKSVKALGGNSVLIGHLEERNDYLDILNVAKADDKTLVNHFLNKEMCCAQAAGLSILYCVGERAEEKEQWQEVLRTQLQQGLADIDKSKVTIAYEPVWSIGPGKPLPTSEYISKIAQFIKHEVGEDVPVVYGGGLKEDNATMISSIKELSGGLIALTRFSGEIGFYPDEFLKIVELYLQ